MVFDRRGKKPDSLRILGTASPEQALDGEIVRFGATGGEDHITGVGPEVTGDDFAGLFHHAACATTCGVQR
ncbi:unannotated protein [freshwater metagenome]|uniref:Unannotated protein n=1 Tax=freshwater metagenome TaxID=449393 RepID=A0A6J6Y4B0_9ZZZZ